MVFFGVVGGLGMIFMREVMLDTKSFSFFFEHAIKSMCLFFSSKQGEHVWLVGVWSRTRSRVGNRHV